MKILHVIPSVGALRGGPSQAIIAITRGLVDAGHHVHVATTDDNGPGHLDVALDRPVERDGAIYWYFRRQTRFYTCSWPLTKWLAKHIADYDLVHIHALFSYAAIPAALFAARSGVPYIVRPLGTLNRWGMQSRRRRLKYLSFCFIERHILSHAAAIHYTSEQERQQANVAGIRTHAEGVIPLGIDLSSFSCLPGPEVFIARFSNLKDRPIILFLSRLDPKKGVDLLLPAFAKVYQQNPSVILVVAGNGEATFVDILKTEAHKLGIGDKVVWAGFLSGIEKLSALSAAHIFVLPSYSENFGIVVVEAMAASLPVVISNEVGIAEEVEKAEAGRVVPCQVDALASALHHLVSNPTARGAMGENGRRLAVTAFSIEAMTDGLLSLYRSILRSKHNT